MREPVTPDDEPAPFLTEGIDFERPNAARLYDYFLGGAHNFAVDRDLGQQMIDVNPHVVQTARSNRAFLGRVVRWCLAHGIDQFLDLGSGVPTVGNVHEIAHREGSRARVAYVDFEPVAVAHAREIIDSTGIADTVTITRADLRDAESVLRSPGVADLLDFTRPVALLMLSVLHFVPESDDPAGVLARYRRQLATGSILSLSHTSDDYEDPDLSRRMRASVEVTQGSATPAVTRSRTRLGELLADLELVDPGLVDVLNWPQDTGANSGHYGAVARVTASAAG